MDKPISFSIILISAFILLIVSLIVYIWLKSLIIKDSDDNIERSS